ncbi:NlpC/P60 family protein [uncultured Anaerococcus sp.]|uniref:NlpC/P60 family protein n=1 Tax=uncultured Anaerococcus sp. TaxID=293428 RepID=UPI00288A3265|nr:NlpC/P60 family protein [uncultured Anaerococcus sp.]
MSKKNIGAALSVIAASAAVATAYATTVTDLENDKHTNSLITEEDKEVDSSYSFVKSDYTKEVKNTKIAGVERDAKKASQEIKKDIIIEKTAKTLVETQIVNAEKKAEASEDENEVVVYDDKNLDEIIEEKAQAEVKDVVVYDNQNIDEVAKEQVATYKENTEVAPLAEEKAAPAKVEAPVVSDKFVNTASLNIRASKDASTSDNIVRTIKAGDKLVGHVEGNWFVTNEGYVSLDYLANYYPQDLVNKVNAEEEARRAQEAKAAEQARLAEEARKAQEAKQAEAARKAEEARKAQEAQKQQVKQTVQQVEKVVQEQAVNTQAPAGQGAQGAVNVASQFVGYSYVWGSANPSVGFDCSGLTSYAYKQVGVNLPHSSQAQFNNGYAVDTNNLKPGDLVFFSFGGGSIDHVGMITSSDGSFIHASTPQTGVRYDNIFNGSYQTAFRGARRIY